MVLDFDKLKKIGEKDLSVLPVVVQNIQSKDVLILAYVNEEALQKSQSTGYAVFWSTSRNQLWEKGASSGNRLKLKEVRVNCEQNSLVFLVEPEKNGVCHTIDTNTGQHRPTCYYRKLDGTFI